MDAFLSMSQDPVSVLTYLFLSLAIVSMWISESWKVWGPLLSLSLCTGLMSGRLSFFSFGFILVFGYLSFYFFRKDLNRTGRWAAGLAWVLLALAFALHRIPGFQNWMLISDLHLTPGALPFRFYLNFDKALVGVFFLAWGYRTLKTKKEWTVVFKQTLPVVGLACFVLMGLSFLFNYVQFDPKWFPFSWTFLYFNLLFVCVSEEVFFRGFIQGRLTQLFPKESKGRYLAWIIASVLFGLMHFPGGWTYVLLSTVAGLFYGYAYLKTNRVEASILTHFAVNAIHFMFFTYPALNHWVLTA